MLKIVEFVMEGDNPTNLRYLIFALAGVKHLLDYEAERNIEYIYALIDENDIKTVLSRCRVTRATWSPYEFVYEATDDKGRLYRVLHDRRGDTPKRCVFNADVLERLKKTRGTIAPTYESFEETEEFFFEELERVANDPTIKLVKFR